MAKKNAEEELRNVAREHGWVIGEALLNPGSWLKFARGSDWIYVEFSSRGGITYAHSPGRGVITGLGKRETVLRWLTGARGEA